MRVVSFRLGVSITEDAGYGLPWWGGVGNLVFEGGPDRYVQWGCPGTVLGSVRGLEAGEAGQPPLSDLVVLSGVVVTDNGDDWGEGAHLDGVFAALTIPLVERRTGRRAMTFVRTLCRLCRYRR